MDHRDCLAVFGSLFEGAQVDERSMRIIIEVCDENGDEIEIDLRFHYEACTSCDGKGRYVNPSIDSHGLSREDFDEDPDFGENYMSGMYDVTCEDCLGIKKD